MLLAINIGNSNSTFGIFSKEKLLAEWKLPMVPKQQSKEFAVLLEKSLTKKNLSFAIITEIILGSVVPSVTPSIVDFVQTHYSFPPLVVNSKIKLPIELLVDHPEEVGADIIADVVGANVLYGGPAIVVDLGTATTFNVLSKEGDFIGTAIAPGITMFAQGLTDGTALLPEVVIKKPNAVIGTNTIDCMMSGIVFGYADLIEGMIGRMKKEIGPAKVILTGGGTSSPVAQELRSIDVVRPSLTLEGLRCIYEMNN